MRTLLFAAMAVSCAVALGAQTQPKSSADRDASKRVTVSGCVERADQMTPSDAAATTVDSLSFVLIRPMAEKPAGTTGTVTADAARANDPDPRLYRLDGTVDQLNPHAGQKVEIVGVVADVPTEPKGTTSPANVPRLKVESVKMISATCPR
jgi:hypothetical protein